jgi:ubiquitin C-terminal hydrolase
MDNISDNTLTDNEIKPEIKPELKKINPYILHRIQMQKNNVSHIPLKYSSNNYNIDKSDIVINLTTPSKPISNEEIVRKKQFEHLQSLEQMNQNHPLNKQVYKPDDISKPLGMIGLSNLGNTCYMSSVLQCLFNCSIFKDVICNSDIIKDLYPYVIPTVDESDKNNYSIILAKSQLTITFQMHKLINVIWSKSNQSKIVRPINFKNVFGNKIENFQSFEQQDSQEALLCILDSIHIELQKSVDIDYKIFSAEYLALFEKIENEKTSDIDCCLMENKYPDLWELLSLKRSIDKYNKKSYSCISNIFQNMISSTVECPDCNFHSYSFEPSIIITVPIPNERNIDINKVEEQLTELKHLSDENLEKIKKHLILLQCSNQIFQLSDCFTSLINKERLDDTNKWFCPNCNDKVNAIKKFNIWIPPKIMIIQLKRFIHNFSDQGYSAHKLNNKIEYPIDGFDITNYMSNCSKKFNKHVGNFIYDLISVTNHIGNMNSGHYFSFVKSIVDEKWYCADDDNITLINKEDIISSNAYLLFYKQREN